MREIGMMFKPAMVRWLLRAAKGEPFGKFETRRIFEKAMGRGGAFDVPTSANLSPVIGADDGPTGEWWVSHPTFHRVVIGRVKPRAKDGDTIYAREAWKRGLSGNPAFFYRADNHIDIEGWPWKPSIDMPRAAARLFMPDIRVRAERLQDITEEGARREGCYQFDPGELHVADPALPLLWTMDGESGYPTAREACAAYIETINGPGTWADNPWVFVYSWERVELR